MFGSRYLGQESSKRDEILQVTRRGLVYPVIQTGDLWPRGAKILKGVKKFVTLFSKVVSALSIKFGMMGAFGVAGLKKFW